MPIYKFYCKKCKKNFDGIVKIDTIASVCSKCRSLCLRVHGQDIPAPPILYGEGFYKQSKRNEVE